MHVSFAPRWTAARVAVMLVAACAFEGAVRHRLAAQERVGVAEESLDGVRRRIDIISPGSGPPGTVVTLRTGGLPAVTPVRIGVGAVRFGFEEIAQALTDMRGEISLTVEVPPWAQRDLTHVFIVFDYYFAPIALSDVFHVTGPDGTIRRRGTLSGTGAPCPMLRGDDGVRYALIGDLSRFGTGDEIVVDGTIAEPGACAAGTAVRVTRVVRAATPRF